MMQLLTEINWRGRSTFFEEFEYEGMYASEEYDDLLADNIECSIDGQPIFMTALPDSHRSPIFNLGYHEFMPLKQREKNARVARSLSMDSRIESTLYDIDRYTDLARKRGKSETHIVMMIWAIQHQLPKKYHNCDLRVVHKRIIAKRVKEAAEHSTRVAKERVEARVNDNARHYKKRQEEEAEYQRRVEAAQLKADLAQHKRVTESEDHAEWVRDHLLVQKANKKLRHELDKKAHQDRVDQFFRGELDDELAMDRYRNKNLANFIAEFHRGKT